ncbi:MAG: MBL fold metallo-hydrolase [Balneolaceae bacterium]
MKIQKFEVGPFGENTYLLVKSGEAVVIDPGFSNESEFGLFEKALSESGAELIAVVLTHAHVDHILGLTRLLKKYPLDVYLNYSDLYLWNRFPEQATMFGIQAAKINTEPKELPVRKDFTLGSFSMDVRYTPGHAPDHVSIYFEQDNVVIAGDALFKQSIGRTDLYKGDFDLLAKSIRKELYTLPNETRVLPGHGPETTIGFEKKNNSFVTG